MPVSFPQTLNDVDFVNEREGWAVGSKGYPPHSGIIHTEDGGQTWVVQDSLTYPGALYGVTFLDTLKGFAVGDSGLILRTFDGGKTWDSIPSGTKNNLYDIQFADSMRGIIVGRGYCLLTEDGGVTWIEGTGGPGMDVAFPDTLHIWTSSGYFSGDGGKTWEYQDLPDVPYNALNGIFFPDTAHGWIVGDYGRVFHYSIPEGIEETGQDQRSKIYSLKVSPNPFKSLLIISFSLPKSSYVSLKIYDISGKLVWSLVNGGKPVGQHRVSWNEDLLSSGVYFVKLEVDGLAKGYKKIIKLN